MNILFSESFMNFKCFIVIVLSAIRLNCMFLVPAFAMVTAVKVSRCQTILLQNMDIPG